jgi:phospholipase C
LPYELAADGQLSVDREQFTVRLHAGNERFGKRSAGAPFTAYFQDAEGELQVRNYAVTPGSSIEDSWPLAAFAEGVYDIELHGPNGFYRHFRGTKDDPKVEVALLDSNAPESSTLSLQISNRSDRPRQLAAIDRAYGTPEQNIEAEPNQTTAIGIDTDTSHGWYDLQLHDPANLYFMRVYAGRAERGDWSRTDPQIGAKREQV